MASTTLNSKLNTTGVETEEEKAKRLRDASQADAESLFGTGSALGQKADAIVQKSVAASPLLAKPLSTFDAQEKAARQRSAESGAFGGQNLYPSQSAGPTTRLLDRYDALQGSQMGSTSALREGPKSLESDAGRAMRMARKLQRSGFGRAAEQIALDGAQTGLKEPTLKSQDYASGVQSKNDASLAAAQSFQTGMEEEAKLRRDLLKAQLESFRNTNPKPV